MKLSSFLTAGLLFFAVTLEAQNIDSTLERYATSFAPERCYLHYDKSSYAAGETIWFKAYLMNGVYPADESKTFYVDWTDDKGNLLSHTVHPVVEAATNGQFTVPSNYTGSFIHVRAYTKWMLNFDSAFLYDKDIRILGKKPAAPVKPLAVVTTLQFFPEGGEVIQGVVNKVAFKANDQWGRPVKIKGVVLDDAGVRIDSLRVIHDGMGFFYWLPGEGKKYTVKWKDEKGVESTGTLPTIKTSGVSMQVGLATSRRVISLVASPETAASLKTVNLVGTMDQNQAFKVSRDISSGSARAIIPTEGLPSGILTITVFDNAWKPIAERITYINNDDYEFKPSFNVEHWGLSKRARNEISITVPDSIVANLSISVTDVDIDADSSSTIISHLMLSGHLKGQVHNRGIL